MRTAFVVALLLVAVVLAPGTASAVSSYDFSENWDSGWTSKEKINKNGWSCSSSSGSAFTGAWVDSYQRYSSPYSAHIGCQNSYNYSGYDNSYLRYTFSSPTPGPGVLTFWCYIYYSSFNLRYSSDGVTWVNTEYVPNYSYIYGETKTVNLPAGVKYIEFWGYSYRYYYYYYGCHIDNISFVMSEVWVTDISGYDEAGNNAGVLNITAEADTAFTSPVDKVSFEYRESGQSAWTLISTDFNGADGWTCVWDTGAIVDIKCGFRATAYVGSATGPHTVFIDIKNPVFDSFTAYPSLDGQMIPLGVKFGKKTYSLTWPSDGWTSSTTGNYINLVMNAGESAPIAGNYTSYTTYFSYVYTGIQGWHSFKLLDSTAPYFRCIASGAQTNSATGAQTYQLTGTQWSNIPKGVYQGIYVYYANIYNYTSSNNKNMYYSSSGNIGVGTAPYWYSYASYYCPTQATIGGESPYPVKAEFGYSLDKQTVIPVGQVNMSTDSAAINWDSTFAIDDAEVWFAVRGHNGNYWGGWHFAPESSRIINRADITVNTSMDAGTLTFEGETMAVPFNVNIFVSWENPFSYSVGADEYQLENSMSDRWRFDNWSDNGDRFHNMVFTGDSLLAGNTTVTANYVRQYYLQTVSDAPVAGPEDGFYDVGYRVVSTGQQLIINEPFRDRRFCIGWEAFGPGLTSEVAEAIFYMTTKTTLVWYYRREFSLLIYNDKGQTIGSLPGWYPDGTELTVSVNQHITNGLSRQDCRGFTATGPVTAGSTNTSGRFVLSGPAEFHWIWQNQHFVSFATNFGATSPAAQWFDEGSVVPIDAASPGDGPWTKYTFVSWTGTGLGSVTYYGDQTAHSITVNGPITQTAKWDIWHRLATVAENGTLVDDPSGWYLRDTVVGVRADAPEAATGERWVIEWEGDEPANTIARDPFNPFTVYVTMSSGATQLVRFHKQYLLTVINPNMAAVVVPTAGYSWHYGGEPVVGNAQFATDLYFLSGYAGMGSLGSGTEPYFSFVINEPTIVSWQWTDRPLPPTQFWHMPTEVITEGAEHIDCAQLPDGRFAAAFFSQSSNAIMYVTGDGTNWSGSALVSDVPGVDGLALSIVQGYPVVAYYSSADHHLYYAYPVDAAVGGQGTQVMLLDDVGDAGRSPSIAIGNGGEIYIAYIDSGLGQVKLATIAGGVITFDVVPFDGTASLYASIAVRPNDGAPVIAFYDAKDRALACAIKEGGNWTVEVVDNDGIVGFFCRVATSPSGEIFIAYQDVTVVNRPVVKVAHRDYYSWHISAVDNAISGYHLDMILDAYARPHILSSNGWQLRYTRSTNTGWESMTIPNPYAIGSGIGLLMLPEGKPVAFYTSDEKIGYIDALSDTLVNVGETSDGVVPITPTPVEAGGGGGCFVATAAFASSVSTELQALCSMRDTVLSASSPAACLVSLYYTVSPSVAASVASEFAVRAVLRELLSR